MKRLFWVAAGVAVGVIAARAVSRAVHESSPRGLATHAGRAWRDFADDVRDGMSARETELLEALGLSDRAPGGA